jgi:hypothetical protein
MAMENLRALQPEMYGEEFSAARKKLSEEVL